MGKLQIYKSKKDLWALGFIVLVVLFFVSPISDRAPGYLYAIFQGQGTELGGYKIYTGMNYLYHHDELAGGVSLSKVSKNYLGTEPGYHLNFEGGAQEKIGEVTQYCLREDSSCERISFRNFQGITISNYIESGDQILNQVIYFSSRCNVHIWHTGVPFESKYLEVIERFFSDNCSEKNS